MPLTLRPLHGSGTCALARNRSRDSSSNPRRGRPWLGRSPRAASSAHLQLRLLRGIRGPLAAVRLGATFPDIRAPVRRDVRFSPGRANKKPCPGMRWGARQGTTGHGKLSPTTRRTVADQRIAQRVSYSDGTEKTRPSPPCKKARAGTGKSKPHPDRRRQISDRTPPSTRGRKERGRFQNNAI